LSQVAERRVWFGTNATDYAATVYTYDNLGQVTSETVKDSGATTFLKTEYAYDAAGNRTAVRVFPAAASSGATTISEYDALNNLISVTDALTNRTTIAYDYSGTGLKTTVTDPLTNHVATARDALGRETTVEHRNMTNGLLRLTEYRYDPNGNRTRAIETVTGSNRVITTGWAYDSRNRPQIMTEALDGGTGWPAPRVGVAIGPKS
jgi:YD repeat-containing protein